MRKYISGSWILVVLLAPNCYGDALLTSTTVSVTPPTSTQLINTPSTAPTFQSGACTQVPNSQSCLDSTPCKTDPTGVVVCLSTVALVSGGAVSSVYPQGALNVPEACWTYAYQYACASDPNAPSQPGTQPLNGCVQEQANPACTLVDSVCSSQIGGKSGANNCVQYQQTYSCAVSDTKAQSAQTAQPAICSDTSLQSSALAINAAALSPSANTPSSFAQASTAMEIASEMQTYSGCSAANPANCTDALLFSGTPESCSKGWLGLKNCCRAQPGAQSNAAMLGLVLGPAASVVKYAAEVGVDSASPYVFDAMYTSGAYSAGMLSAFAQSANVVTDSDGFVGGTVFASSGLSLGAFGFTMGLGSAPVSTGLFGATSQVETLSSATQGYYVTFNPYLFAASMSATIIQSMAQCTVGETLLAMHRGQDLSVYVNEVCSEKLALTKSCTLYQDNYCSFNGVIGKIINQQGKAQLGLDFSSCSGLSISQIMSLNFATIDFSEFTAQLTQQAQSNLPNNISSNYLAIEQSMQGGSVQSQSNGLSYPARAP